MQPLNIMLRPVCFCALAAYALATPVRAETVILTPAADATISEKDKDLDPTLLEVGTNGQLEDSRALLKFDCAGTIPTNAVVTSAALTVQLVHAARNGASAWFDLRKVLRPWSEAAVTWTNRLSTPSPWSTPGGAAQTDFASIVTQSNLITTTLGFYTFITNPQMVADVQDWVRNPSNNWGWMLICEAEGVSQSVTKYSSREGSAPPSLAVQYTLPPAPPMLTPLSLLAGQFRFSFGAESNRPYTVEHIGAPAASNWTVLTNIPALPAAANVVISDVLTESNRLYRVRTP